MKLTDAFKKNKEDDLKARKDKIFIAKNEIKTQILTLETKRDQVVKRIVEAQLNGLPEQEEQGRVLLRQIIQNIKREQGMLMTLEFAAESRDIAQINQKFLESISALSDDVLGSGDHESKAKTRKMNDKYIRAVVQADQQKQKIDQVIDQGDFSGAINVFQNDARYDAEIDALVQQNLPRK